MDRISRMFAPTVADVWIIQSSPACSRCANGKCPTPTACECPTGPAPLSDGEWPPTIQHSAERLRDTGFGPLPQFGDEPQRDGATWAVIVALCTISAACAYGVIVLIGKWAE